jgi:hypothetical protein
VPEKPAKPERKQGATSNSKARRTKVRSVDQTDVATRAYYISLDEGSSNDIENWLRAEREVTAA